MSTMCKNEGPKQPLSLMMIQQAGVPDGVLNVVPGFGSIAGAAISSHMDIDKVTT